MVAAAASSAGKYLTIRDIDNNIYSGWVMLWEAMGMKAMVVLPPMNVMLSAEHVQYVIHIREKNGGPHTA